MAKPGSSAPNISPEERERYWRRAQRQWQSSGLSQIDFCRKRRISIWSFRWWNRRLGGPKKAKPRAKPALPTLLPVQVIESPDPIQQVPLELEVNGGRIVRIRSGFDRQTLRALIAALEDAR